MPGEIPSLGPRYTLARLFPSRRRAPVAGKGASAAPKAEKLGRALAAESREIVIRESGCSCETPVFQTV